MKQSSQVTSYRAMLAAPFSALAALSTATAALALSVYSPYAAATIPAEGRLCSLFRLSLQNRLLFKNCTFSRPIWATFFNLQDLEKIKLSIFAW